MFYKKPTRTSKSKRRKTKSRARKSTKTSIIPALIIESMAVVAIHTGGGEFALAVHCPRRGFARYPLGSFEFRYGFLAVGVGGVVGQLRVYFRFCGFEPIRRSDWEEHMY